MTITLDQLPRIPGFKYAPKLVECKLFTGTGYRVQQSGFWMDSRVKGPVEPTKAEAVAAWRRLVRRITK